MRSFLPLTCAPSIVGVIALGHRLGDLDREQLAFVIELNPEVSRIHFCSAPQSLSSCLPQHLLVDALKLERIFDFLEGDLLRLTDKEKRNVATASPQFFQLDLEVNIECFLFIHLLTPKFSLFGS